MDDLISRQAVIEAVKRLSLGETDATRLAMRIGDYLKRLPSAQTEIIRCKDCKFYDGRPCGIVDWYNAADDFCSRAERRTDE